MSGPPGVMARLQVEPRGTQLSRVVSPAQATSEASEGSGMRP